MVKYIEQKKSLIEKAKELLLGNSFEEHIKNDITTILENYCYSLLTKETKYKLKKEIEDYLMELEYEHRVEYQLIVSPDDNTYIINLKENIMSDTIQIHFNLG